MNRDPKVVAAVAALCEAFGRTPTEATFAAYAIGLAGVAPESVERAAAAALRRCRFMPSPAELREFAMTGGVGYEALAERAFASLRDAIRRHGADASVNFADSAINATVRRLGGWARCCHTPREEFDKWLRKEFLAAYGNVVRDGASDRERAYLAGGMELENARFVGHPMRSGVRYELGVLGSHVRLIGSDYTPLIPAVQATQQTRIGGGSQFGLTLKEAP